MKQHVDYLADFLLDVEGACRMDPPHSLGSDSQHKDTPKLTPARWVERVFAGLFWGWVWWALVTGGWLGLAVAAYGDISRATEAMMGKTWALFVYSAGMASTLSSFVGGCVAPLFVGSARCRVARPVLLSSLIGAASGALIGAVTGCVAEWVSQQFDARSMVGMRIAVGGALPLGLLGGWLGGRAVLGARTPVGESVERTV